MLYLEDYVEMIEHLPQELRERFTEMRELDLQVQNSMDSLEKRVTLFFSNAKKMKLTEKDTEFELLKKEYYRTLEDADEKVQLANNMYDLVGKYYRRLEQEVHKFKMELEADNMGITEILEKRSHEKEVPSNNSSQKENRYSVPSQRTNYYGGEKRRESCESGANKPPRLDKVEVLGGGGVAPGYSLSHMGAGRTAIAAAASQAIAATQQMQQGRRTASLKASYEAIGGVSGSGGVGTPGAAATEISKEIAGAAQTAIAAIQDTHKKHKTSSSGSSRKAALSGGVPSPASLPSPDTPASDRNNSSDYDPNEPRYCVCNEVAFGTMVACDNKTCPYEWYHYPCVGITEKPKGKWYCPHCTAAMKRRNRKN